MRLTSLYSQLSDDLLSFGPISERQRVLRKCWSIWEKTAAVGAVIGGCTNFFELRIVEIVRCNAFRCFRGAAAWVRRLSSAFSFVNRVRRARTCAFVLLQWLRVCHIDAKAQFTVSLEEMSALTTNSTLQGQEELQHLKQLHAVEMRRENTRLAGAYQEAMLLSHHLKQWHANAQKERGRRLHFRAAFAGIPLSPATESSQSSPEPHVLSHFQWSYQSPKRLSSVPSG